MDTISLLKFVTCGSVDDGKSTLIGRLLFETNAILEDQYESIRKTSQKCGHKGVDLSLLMDGLAAEREQAITIDVAHHYFATAKRKFIIADCPGHEQYTRNMITGASTSGCAVLLIDARKGVLTQSKRHSFIVSLLGIPHVVVAVNKMDLIGYSETVYREIVDEFIQFSKKLNIPDIQFIPVSALKGDNVVNKSNNMPWFDGSTLLHYLESVHVHSDVNLVDFRFPVQGVIRPHFDFRGYTGMVTSGMIAVGEEITVLPSGKESRLKAVVTFDGELQECSAGMSVILTLENEIDISRGDMIVRRNNLPQITQEFDSILCWLNEREADLKRNYILKHTTKTSNSYIHELNYKIDINTLHREKTSTLNFNEVGRAKVKVSQPVCVDPYQLNRATGSFILIDPDTNFTVAAGMIRNPSGSDTLIKAKQNASPNTIWGGWNIYRQQHEGQNGHKAAVIWLTGLSGAGKSTIGRALEKKLFDMGLHTMLLDGDNLRHGLCCDLGFSEKDRNENIRRAGEVAKLFFEAGNIVICTFISPFRSQRTQIRNLIHKEGFYEIYIRCSFDECKRRDPKSLYKKAEAGEIENFTGISSEYEEPLLPELILDTETGSVEDNVEDIVQMLQNSGVFSYA